jgi:hypothetical protein
VSGAQPLPRVLIVGGGFAGLAVAKALAGAPVEVTLIKMLTVDVATTPNMAGLFRVDQLVAALARERLWLTDAYYAGTTAYVQALRAAARDGVDVRLLVPNGTDIPLLRPLSRSGYRTLLEAGVRVFEWNGPMLHAKTAVADGRWARGGLDQPQRGELARQPRARRHRRGSALRGADGDDVPGRPHERRRGGPGPPAPALGPPRATGRPAAGSGAGRRPGCCA